MTMKKKSEQITRKGLAEKTEILLLAGSLTQADTLKDILEPKNYHLTIAHHSREALDQIRQKRPVLIISEVISPEMDGYKLCQSIKTDNSLKDILVVLLIDPADPRDIIKGLEVGADDFIIKPYDERILLDKLEDLLLNLAKNKTRSPEAEIEIFFRGEKYLLRYDFHRIFDVLLSGFKTFIQNNRELSKVRDELMQINLELVQSKIELSSRNKIANIFLTVPGERVYELALQVIMEALESENGIFGYLDQEGDLVVPTMTGEVVWERCQVSDKKIVFPNRSWGQSSWCKALREKQVFFSNEPSCKIPKGHIPMQRHISQPIVYQEESIGLLQVANKQDDYNEKDLSLMQTIADHIAPILKSRLETEKEQKSRLLVEESLYIANICLKKRAEELEIEKQTADAAKKQAEIANRAKSDFLANMSHELRTPLNSVIGFSELLQDKLYGDLNKQQEKYVANILESGKFLLSLINDILDLTKVESGKMELELNTFLLRDLLRSSLMLLKEKAMNHNIKVGFEISPGADIEITADERKLKQIMFNLLSNALKFTPDGGSVQVQASMPKGNPDSLPGEGRFIQISVQDTGIGIKSEDKDRIFNEFTQLETILNKKYQGTGLGLALTKKLIELHGGRIWVESEYGLGSTFSFIIPFDTERIS